MKTIKSESEYNEALKRIDELLEKVGNDTNTFDPNFIELDKLSDLVADYEEKYYPIPEPSLIDIIKLKMFENDLSQKSLATLLGTSSTRINEYLKGKREITLNIAKALHKKLNIDPEIILNS